MHRVGGLHDGAADDEAATNAHRRTAHISVTQRARGLTAGSWAVQRSGQHVQARVAGSRRPAPLPRAGAHRGGGRDDALLVAVIRACEWQVSNARGSPAVSGKHELPTCMNHAQTGRAARPLATPSCAPAGRMPGTTRVKSAPHAARMGSISFAEHTTPPMPHACAMAADWQRSACKPAHAQRRDWAPVDSSVDQTHTLTNPSPTCTRSQMGIGPVRASRGGPLAMPPESTAPAHAHAPRPC